MISVIVIGAITILFGIIFYLQGLAILGPQTSFMYSNPSWITHGFQIGVIGIIIVGVGLGRIVWIKMK